MQFIIAAKPSQAKKTTNENQHHEITTQTNTIHIKQMQWECNARRWSNQFVWLWLCKPQMISSYSRTHCICFNFIELTICTSDATTAAAAVAVVASVSIFARMYTKQIKSNRIDTICRVCGLARQIARCFFSLGL